MHRVRQRNRSRSIVVAAVLLLCVSSPASNDDPTLQTVRRLIEQGRYAEADELARAITAQTSVSSEDRPVELAAALTLFADAARRNGRYMDADVLESAERALSIREHELGPGHHDTADSLAVLGRLHFDRGEFEHARERLRRAVEILESVPEPAPVATAKLLDDLGRIAWDLDRDCASALALFERARTLMEQHGARDADLAGTLCHVANCWSREGRREEALALHERSLSLRLDALGPNHPDLAESYTRLAHALEHEGRVREATRHHELALDVLEASLRPGHPRIASAMVRLADDLQGWGSFDEARELLEEALVLLERALGPDHWEIGDVTRKLGDGFMFEGRYSEARAMYERALVVWEQAYGPGHRKVALAANSLARHDYMLGDFDAAIPMFERAAAIWGSLEDLFEGAAWFNLGDVYFARGETANARILYQRALALFEERLNPEHTFVAAALEGLADVSWPSGGDLPRAKSLCERSLSILEHALGPDHFLLANPLVRLARIHEAMGDWEGARDRLERARSVLERGLGPEHPDTAFLIHELAWLHWTASHEDDAFDLALRANRLMAEHSRLIVRVLPERQAIAYVSTRPSGADRSLPGRRALGYVTARSSGVDLLASIVSRTEHASRVDRTWDAVIRSRALVLDELALRHRAMTGTDAMADGAARLASARRRVANLSYRGPGRSEERYRDLLAAARTDVETAERALAERSVRYRERLDRARVGLREVVDALPRGTALVAYVRYGDVPPEPGMMTHEPTPTYVAFVLSAPGSTPAVVPLGPAEEIDGRIAAWRSLAATAPQPLEPAAREAETRTDRAGERLRSVIWDPLLPLIGDARRVLVVAGGDVHLVNLAALPAGDGRYLLEMEPGIHQISAERDIVPQEARPSGRGLLAMGGADFDEARSPPPDSPPRPRTEAPAPVYRGPVAPCPEFGSLRFEPLPGTDKEAREVAEIWNAAVARDLGDPDARATVASGSSANEARFKANAPGRAAVHVATHGFFLGGPCGKDANRSDAPRTTSHAGAPYVDVVGGNPLLLSGIALAGANDRNSRAPGEEDGILTAEEIASLDLSGVRWAVLSACETGSGQVLDGEGVLGLRRAFEIAGAETLIMSLWAVDDESTREWMVELYRGHLEHDLTTSEAVRQASARVIERRREAGRSTHPFYWGAFVAVGGF